MEAERDGAPDASGGGAQTNIPPAGKDARVASDTPPTTSDSISGSSRVGVPAYHRYKTQIPATRAKEAGASIVVLAETDSPFLSELRNLPAHCSACIFAPEGTDWAATEVVRKLSQCNVLFTWSANAAVMAAILPHMPMLRWVHSLSAGVDHFLCPALAAHPAVLTNARGHYSSTLAEYCLFACLYFSKDVRRWQRNQENKLWDQFSVGELRGTTMGVVGFGDIGQTTAKLARAFGMRIIGLRRQATPSPLADKMYAREDIDKLFEESDYIVVAAALTEDSRGMVGAAQLAKMKPSAVLINVGRGGLIDEEALMDVVQRGAIRGVALDVFCTEPLPPDHPMWGLDKDRCFISSHNGFTDTFAHESTAVFAKEVANFLANKPVCFHTVDKTTGY